jgi:hypothetical protein
MTRAGPALHQCEAWYTRSCILSVWACLIGVGLHRRRFLVLLHGSVALVAASASFLMSCGSLYHLKMHLNDESISGEVKLCHFALFVSHIPFYLWGCTLVGQTWERIWKEICGISATLPHDSCGSCHIIRFMPLPSAWLCADSALCAHQYKLTNNTSATTILCYRTVSLTAKHSNYLRYVRFRRSDIYLSGDIARHVRWHRINRGEATSCSAFTEQSNFMWFTI